MASANQNNPTDIGQYKTITSDSQTVRPFKLYKTWTGLVISPASNNIASSSVPVAYDAFSNYNINLYTDTNEMQTGSIWYAIRNMFYGKFNFEGSGTLSSPTGYTVPPYYNQFTSHSFYGSSSFVVSIPQSMFGESIQKNMTTLNFNSSSQIYNISDDGFGNLFDTNTNSGSIGNISYDNGLIIITDSYHYLNMSNSMFVNGDGATSFSLNYTSYYTAYQYEYICDIKSYEFNNTINPTAYDTDVSGHKIMRFADIYDSSGSIVNFKPLVSGISLIDNTGQAVVVAKFAKPVRMENDIDSIFVVRFDV